MNLVLCLKEQQERIHRIFIDLEKKKGIKK